MPNLVNTIRVWFVREVYRLNRKRVRITGNKIRSMGAILASGTAC